jgi:hypothetical protein
MTGTDYGMGERGEQIEWAEAMTRVARSIVASGLPK